MEQPVLLLKNAMVTEALHLDKCIFFHDVIIICLCCTQVTLLHRLKQLLSLHIKISAH